MGKGTIIPMEDLMLCLKTFSADVESFLNRRGEPNDVLAIDGGQ